MEARGIFCIPSLVDSLPPRPPPLLYHLSLLPYKFKAKLSLSFKAFRLGPTPYSKIDFLAHLLDSTFHMETTTELPLGLLLHFQSSGAFALAFLSAWLALPSHQLPAPLSASPHPPIASCQAPRVFLDASSSRDLAPLCSPHPSLLPILRSLMPSALIWSLVSGLNSSTGWRVPKQEAWTLFRGGPAQCVAHPRSWELPRGRRVAAYPRGQDEEGICPAWAADPKGYFLCSVQRHKIRLLTSGSHGDQGPDLRATPIQAAHPPLRGRSVLGSPDVSTFLLRTLPFWELCPKPWLHLPELQEAAQKAGTD